MKATVRFARFRFTPFPVHTVPVHGSQRFTFFLVIVFDATFSGAIVFDTILFGVSRRFRNVLKQFSKFVQTYFETVLRPVCNVRFDTFEIIQVSFAFFFPNYVQKYVNAQKDAQGSIYPLRVPNGGVAAQLL